MTGSLQSIFLLSALLLFSPACPGTVVDPLPKANFVTVNGLRLQFVDWGGRGDVLLFIPGGCDTPYVFGDVAPAFVDQFRVLGLTPRGCGASDHPDSGYDMESQISDLVGFLDALGAERVTLVGHSMGGGRITRFARRYPLRVTRLVYLDTVFRFVPPGLEEIISAAIQGAVGGNNMESVELWKRTTKRWELGAWSRAMEQNMTEVVSILPNGHLRYRDPSPPAWQKDVAADMQAGVYFETRISHPTLMIFAMDTDRDRAKQFDQATRRKLQPLVEEIERKRLEEIEAFRSNGPNVRVVKLHHTAHYCFVHKPKTVIKLMKFFLSQPVP